MGYLRNWDFSHQEWSRLLNHLLSPQNTTVAWCGSRLVLETDFIIDNTVHVYKYNCRFAKAEAIFDWVPFSITVAYEWSMDFYEELSMSEIYSEGLTYPPEGRQQSEK